MRKAHKGSYYFPELSNHEEEIELLRQVSLTASELEKSIFKELNISKKAKILDLGCGPGFISAQLAKFFPSGTVTGVDSSKELLRQAKIMQQVEMLSNLNFKHGDIYNLDADVSDFELTYLRFVLQHLKNPVGALVSAAKTLRSGGILCAVDIDDEQSQLHPAPAALKSFNQRAVKWQAASGGDRNIGSKLKKYFLAADLLNPQVMVKTLSSRDIGIDNFIDLLIKTRYPVIPDAEQEAAQKEVEEIYAVANDPVAWGTMDIFVATGIKR
ncbi:MAG: class I SAM-dependent methyltransferase [Victivallaceae bacterium]|nr:class I SAM-dependent methyltransferase [Victivallaceae bacterium]